MSGDVQPRKRKDKRKKKDEEEVVVQHGNATASHPRQVSPGPANSEEVIHVYKESHLGGNIISKVVFFGLLGALGVMVGLILIEYHGTSDVDSQSALDSPWSTMLEGWVETGGHDDHDDHAEPEHSDDHDEHDEHEYSEDEHEPEGEEEHEHEHEEDEGEFFAQKTYEDLKAVYNQMTRDDSDTEPATEPPTKEPTPEPESEAVEVGGTESEPEVTESEVSEPETSEPEEEEEEQTPIGQWESENGHKLLADEVEDVQTESETEEEESEDEVPTKSGGAQSLEEEDSKADEKSNEENLASAEISGKDDKESQEMYDFAEITNAFDWEIREDLDDAERDLDDNNPSSALSKFSTLLTSHPTSARASYGKARALDALAETRRSNQLLVEAISAYQAALRAREVPDALLLRVANRTIDRIRFKGLHLKAVDVHNQLINRFPNNISHHIELAITYLMVNSCVAG